MEKIKLTRIALGKEIKEIRLERGISQMALAKLCGVCFQTINKLEKGVLPYSIDLLLKVSYQLSFTIKFKIIKNGK